MRKYHALIFDLCDTLMPYREDWMPHVILRGQSVYTSSWLLFNDFIQYETPLPYEIFHDHFIAAKEAVTALRRSGEEVTASVRFAQFLDRLNVAPSHKRDAMHQRLMKIHLDCVAHCLDCPDENRALLTALHETYPIGLITNFDDTETVYTVLERETVRLLFDAIFISAEFGLRKPRKEIFLAACARLAVSPAQVLFVGDSLTSDIAGAQGVGMDAAWINPDGAVIPEGAPLPNYILKNLLDLPALLEQAGRNNASAQKRVSEHTLCDKTEIAIP